MTTLLLLQQQEITSLHLNRGVFQQTAKGEDSSSSHHIKAADYCNSAATSCQNAAKSSDAGDHQKAAEHEKTAQDYCCKAQDHLKKASMT